MNGKKNAGRPSKVLLYPSVNFTFSDVKAMNPICDVAIRRKLKELTNAGKITLLADTMDNGHSIGRKRFMYAPVNKTEEAPKAEVQPEAQPVVAAESVPA